MLGKVNPNVVKMFGVLGVGDEVKQSPVRTFKKFSVQYQK